MKTVPIIPIDLSRTPISPFEPKKRPTPTTRPRKTMTVGQLINLLQHYPRNKPVKHCWFGGDMEDPYYGDIELFDGSEMYEEGDRQNFSGTLLISNKL